MSLCRAILAAAATAAATSAAIAPAIASNRAGYGINLRAIVPLTCSVRFHSFGKVSPLGQAFELGSFREFCNSPTGYSLLIIYTPGTLRGATIQAGVDRVVLDGSGQTILTRSTQARARTRKLQIIPGVTGLDTEQLELSIIPN